MTLDARTAREGEEQMGKRLDMIRSDFRNNKGVFDADARWLLERLDAAESRYAQLSALVDTWQRRFNLELQRALAAESERDALRAALTDVVNAAGAYRGSGAAFTLAAIAREALSAPSPETPKED